MVAEENGKMQPTCAAAFKKLPRVNYTYTSNCPNDNEFCYAVTTHYVNVVWSYLTGI